MLSDVSNGCKILNSRTALWHAAKAGHPEVVRYLLHGGAAINPRRDYRETNNSGTPLYVSVENGHFPIVMYLIEQGPYYIVTNSVLIIIAVLIGYCDVLLILTVLLSNLRFVTTSIPVNYRILLLSVIRVAL